MISEDIQKPTPMSPEMRARLQELRGVYLDDRMFCYGDNWRYSAAWYQQQYPGFSPEQCRAMEMFSNGVTAKQYRNLLKKQRCSKSRRGPS